MFSLCCYRRQETFVNLGLFQTTSNYSWFLCLCLVMTRSVNLCVIRGYRAVFRSSRCRFTLYCLLRGLYFSLLEYFVKN